MALDKSNNELQAIVEGMVKNGDSKEDIFATIKEFKSTEEENKTKEKYSFKEQLGLKELEPGKLEAVEESANATAATELKADTELASEDGFLGSPTENRYSVFQPKKPELEENAVVDFNKSIEPNIEELKKISEDRNAALSKVEADEITFKDNPLLLNELGQIKDPFIYNQYKANRDEFERLNNKAIDFVNDKFEGDVNSYVQNNYANYRNQTPLKDIKFTEKEEFESLQKSIKDLEERIKVSSKEMMAVNPSGAFTPFNSTGYTNTSEKQSLIDLKHDLEVEMQEKMIANEDIAIFNSGSRYYVKGKEVSYSDAYNFLGSAEYRDNLDIDASIPKGIGVEERYKYENFKREGKDFADDLRIVNDPVLESLKFNSQKVAREGGYKMNPLFANAFGVTADRLTSGQYYADALTGPGLRRNVAAVFEQVYKPLVAMTTAEALSMFLDEDNLATATATLASLGNTELTRYAATALGNAKIRSKETGENVDDLFLLNYDTELKKAGERIRGSQMLRTENAIDRFKKGDYVGFAAEGVEMAMESSSYLAMAMVPEIGPYLVGASVQKNSYYDLRREGVGKMRSGVGSLGNALVAAGDQLIFKGMLNSGLKTIKNTSIAAASRNIKISTQQYKDIAKTFVKNITLEPTTEYVQGFSESVINDWANERYIDLDKANEQGLLEATAAGATTSVIVANQAKQYVSLKSGERRLIREINKSIERLTKNDFSSMSLKEKSKQIALLTEKYIESFENATVAASKATASEIQILRDQTARIAVLDEMIDGRNVDESAIENLKKQRKAIETLKDAQINFIQKRKVNSIDEIAFVDPDQTVVFDEEIPAELSETIPQQKRFIINEEGEAVDRYVFTGRDLIKAKASKNKQTRLKVKNLIEEREELEEELQKQEFYKQSAPQSADEKIEKELSDKIDAINKEINDLAPKNSTLDNIKNIAETIGLEVDIIEVQNSNELAREYNERFGTRKKAKNFESSIGRYREATLDDDGNVISKAAMYLNKDKIAASSSIDVASHEFLHAVLRDFVLKNNENVIAIAASLEDYLLKLDYSKIKNSSFKRRLNLYRSQGKKNSAEETLTLFSDAMLNKSVTYDENFASKLLDSFRRFSQNALGKPITFKTGKDVFKFLKDYNASIKKGKFTKAQAAFATGKSEKPESATFKIDKKLIKEFKFLPSDIDEYSFAVQETIIDYYLQRVEDQNLPAKFRKAKFEELVDDAIEYMFVTKGAFKSIDAVPEKYITKVKDKLIDAEETRKAALDRKLKKAEKEEELQEKKEERKKERDRIKKEAADKESIFEDEELEEEEEETYDAMAIKKQDESSSAVQKIYEKQGLSGAFEIFEYFKPITNKIANKYKSVPGYDKQIIIDELETGKNGIYDLISTYDPNKFEDKVVPLAAYINSLLPLRSVDIVKGVLKEAFEDDIEGRFGGIAAPEEVNIEELEEEEARENAGKINIAEELFGDSKLINKARSLVEERLKNIPKNQVNFKMLGNMVVELLEKETGIPVDKIIDSTKNLSTPQLMSGLNWLKNNSSAIFATLPKGYIQGETQSDFLYGTSTGIRRSLLTKFYTKLADRVNTGPGLFPHVLKNGLTEEDFLNGFGIIDGVINPNVSTRKSEAAALKAIVDLQGRLITNQLVRESDTLSPMEKQDVASGKSDEMFSIEETEDNEESLNNEIEKTTNENKETLLKELNTESKAKTRFIKDKEKEVIELKKQISKLKKGMAARIKKDKIAAEKYLKEKIDPLTLKVKNLESDIKKEDARNTKIKQRILKLKKTNSNDELYEIANDSFKQNQEQQINEEQEEQQEEQQEVEVKKKKDGGIIDTSKTLSEQFNEILEQTTGSPAGEIIESEEATKMAEKKRNFKFFVPYGAEDFLGLMYSFVGKNKTGDAHLEWIYDNLIYPHIDGLNNIDSARASIARNFKQLKKGLNIDPKKLKENIPGSLFSVEDAIRYHIWRRMDPEADIPGIGSKVERELAEFMNKNRALQNFARRVIDLTKDYSYPMPKKGWTKGTISTDLLSALNKEGRAKYLKVWQDNADKIFTVANKNKIKALYGESFIAALNDSLRRMRTGLNTPPSRKDKDVSQFVNWVNGEISSIMFFNSRSAILQLLSTTNFINLTDNNPAAAAAATANGGQFIQDLINLYNSDFLTIRRDGLTMDVNSQDIADIARKKGFVAGLNKLQELGFFFTKFADSSAIALGGAAFYRNRINTYLSKGMSPGEAENKAFNDFRLRAETVQQSSNAMFVSKQQSGGLGRVILAFGNTMMQYNREIKKAGLDLANGRGDWKTNMSKIAYYGFIQNAIFTFIQQAIFAVAFGESGDEDLLKEKSYNSINSMLDSILRGSGLHGAVIASLKNATIRILKENKKDQPKYFLAVDELLKITPPGSSKYAKIKRGLSTFSYDMDEIKLRGISYRSPAIEASFNIISGLTNVPLDRLMRKAKNISDALDSDNTKIQRMFLIAGWPAWQLGIEEAPPKKIIILNDGLKLEESEVTYEEVDPELTKPDDKRKLTPSGGEKSKVIIE